MCRRRSATRVTREIAHAGDDDALARAITGEPFRQYFSRIAGAACRDLQPEAIPGAQSHSPIPANWRTRSIDAERALGQMHATSIAAYTVRPVRWEVEIFGFRTMSLDLRQNTTVINRVLAELWQKFNPTRASASRRRPIRRMGEMGRGRAQEADGFPAAVPGPVGGSARDARSPWRSSAIPSTAPTQRRSGAFVLSMTRSATDILGLYLLAKYSGPLHRCRRRARAAALPSCRCSKPSTICSARPASWRSCSRSRDPPHRSRRKAAPGDHARLFRLQQGWRLLLRELRAL